MQRNSPKPYRFQRIGMRKMWKRFGGRALLGDEMGLGKTPQALLGHKKYNPLRRKGRPLIVVCPAYLKYTWEAEVRLWLKQRAYVCEKEKPPQYVPDAPVYIVNYDILKPKKRKGKARSKRNWVKVLRRKRPSLVVIDESQYIKDMTTLRFKGVKSLQMGVKYLQCMSGTGSMENCPAELFPALNLINPRKWANFYPFARRYCDPKFGRYGWEFKGCSNAAELNRILRKTCMVRRLKKDVLKDLPARRSEVVMLDITNRKEYNEAERDLVKWLMKTHRGKAKKAAKNEKMVKWAYLRKVVGEGKVKAAAEWIRDFLASGQKLIVFGVHSNGSLLKLYETLKKETGAVLVTGKVPPRRRHDLFEKFNTDPRCRLMVGHWDAAGTGWSCRATSTTAAFELPWNPAKVRQGGDRTHGLKRGVKGERSRMIFLTAHNTIDEKMGVRLQKKQGFQDKVLDGKRRSGTDLDLRDMMERILLRKVGL
jgi:SWI/SNF-related matrix-associated actin-dependent regulator 1 of chromatin subfamily A